jgi:uncharacterized protein (DUF2062 family)
MSLKLNRWLHQKGFSRRKLHGSWIHGVMGDGILAKELWSLESDSVARAWLIGVMITIIPLLPFQSLIAVPLAILFRANVPIVYGLQWVSNPITAFIHLPACYYFGCLVLRISPSGAFQEGMKKIEEKGWNAVGQLSFQDVIVPLYVGAVAQGLLISVIGYFLIKAYWPAPKKRVTVNHPHQPRSL